MKKLFVILSTLCGLQGYSQQAPEKSFAENLSGIETANDAQATANASSGGDLSLTVPLLTVQSRTMSFPVQLQYASGITVDQQSSSVGLGWALPFGSIVRDYGAFEPDYTATNSEVDMIHDNPSIQNGWLGGNIARNPGDNHQDLTYEVKTDFGSSGEYSIPDEYHVNVPGFFSNTFWNGSGNEVFDWMFQEDVPYKVENTIKNFRISQEFSRINEANFGTLNMNNLTNPVNNKDYFDRTNSYAYAIGLLPYVQGGEVFIPTSGQSDFNPQGEEKYVKYDDFESFSITDDNGVTYVFGRPLRGQKYLISEDPYWSTINSNAASALNQHATKGNFWKIDFIAEWLLTEIRSVDYIDENGNGMADEGDLGDWIRFEYTDPIKQEDNKLLGGSSSPTQEEVPMYREWSNFSQTDRASSLMMEKAYLTKIVTPLQEIDFTISQRMEVDHDYYSKPANQVGDDPLDKHFYQDRKFSIHGDETDFDIVYPVETMKYDEIVIKDNSKEYALYKNADPIVGKIVLNYATKGSADELAVSEYLIRDNDNQDRLIDKPSEGNQIDISDYEALSITPRGKTTLLGVTFYNSEQDVDDTQQYTFEYADNPSYSEIHKREIVRQKFFPSIRQSNWSGNTLFDPVALNNFDYYTEYGAPTIISANPFDFLIDIPYAETYEKLSIASLNDKKTYLQNTCVNNNPAPIAGSSLYYSHVAHPLHPVKDEMNYMITPDGTATGLQNKDAWSLTKITYPTGASIAFEYEPDNFVMTEDESNWLIDANNIPMISDYNNVAKIRSRVQSVANENDINKGDDLYDKTLTAAFEMELLPTSGGIRLKKKTMNDGINLPIEVDYEYGDGHYTALPSPYIQNAYSGFNSFISRERKRHQWEKSYYHSTYLFYYPDWTTDYDVRMRHFANTETAVDKAKSQHFYETIKEIYPNGSSVMKTYANQVAGAPVKYDEHKIIHSRDIIATNRVKFIYTSDYKPTTGVDLVKVEHFENGAATAYQSEEYAYEIVDVLEFPIWTENDPYTYDNEMEVYLTLSDVLGGFPNDYNVSLAGNNLSVGVGGFSLYESTWANSNNIQQGEAFVNLIPANAFSLGFTQSSSPVQRWGRSKKQLAQKIEDVRGTVNTTSYTYEPTYGYPKTTTRTGAEGDLLIQEDEYGFEVYSGTTTLFEDANLLRPKARTTAYLNSMSNSNALSANFTEYEFTHTYPRQLSLYEYRTSTIDHQTGEFTVVPFNIAGSNPIEWHKIETEPIGYDADGVLSLSRSNRIYAKQVVGYNRGKAKGVISSIEGEFDGTYSGFEDLPEVEDIAIGSLADPEYWYYHDYSLEEKIINGETHLSAWNECGNELVYSPVDPDLDLPDIFHSIKIASNTDVDGQIFFIGDAVEINGFHSGTIPLPTLNTTVTNIIPLIAGEVKLCFEHSLPVDYRDYYWTSTVTGITVSKDVMVQNSSPSKTYSRTGDYSYKLNGKDHPGEIASMTPVRPVIPPDNTLQNYPAICFTAEIDEEDRGYYPPECFIHYETSVWVKYDFNIRKEKIGKEIFSPYYGSGTGGFVTSGSVLTSDDHTNTYVRGTTSTTLASGQRDVKLVYKIWNVARTVVVDEGEFYLDNLDGTWKQYTVEIPLFRGAKNLPIDVYVESNEVQTASIIHRKSTFVDDLVIYPQGAKYIYSSYDKFGAVSHYTYNNDVFVEQQTDEWGRRGKLWNAYGDHISTYEYEVSDDAYMDNSMTETHWTGSNKYFKTRSYTDGFGKVKQTVVSDPNTNKRTVLSTHEYNDMGWLSKTYKPYSINGHYLSGKHDMAYATKVQNLYGTNSAYSETDYLESMEQFAEKAMKPRENTESEISMQSNRFRNTAAIGGVYGIPLYAIDDLLITEMTDAEGNLIKNYTDELGQTVLTEQELGNNYSDNADGTISFSGAVNGPLQTWFEFDRVGRLIKTVDPDGKASEYFYNSIGESIKSIAPDRGATEMRYDTYKQLRFSRSEKDAEVIAGAGIIDQFKYVKYDGWGRVVRSGVMREMSDVEITNGLGEVYDPAVVFDSQSKIDDQEYPLDGMMFNQIKHEFEYDGARATFDSEAVLSERVQSNHTINADYHYIPAQIDETSYTYLLDGNVASKSFLLGEFTAPHIFTYEYTRFGEPIKKSYKNPIDVSYNYDWETTYDNFGRALEYNSGTALDNSLTGKNYYDALGNLYKLGLGETTDPLDPHVDYVIYKHNVRDELISQMSSKLRLGLAYNKNGIITDQYWSSEEFDPTTASSVNVNHYHYYYDKAQRLVGADFREQTFASNPFGYFDGLAATEYNPFDCELNSGVALEEIAELVDDINTGGGGGIGIGGPKQKRATDAAEFIGNEYLKTDIDWARLVPAEQDEFLDELLKEAGSKNIDLKAFEEVMARLANDQDHLELLQSKPTTENAEWKLRGRVSLGSVNSYGEIDISMLKYTKSALSGITRGLVLLGCTTNIDATIYGFLPDFDMSGAETNVTKYDAAYWYSGNGNMEELHRKDHLGGYKNLTYTYSDPSKNLLSAVEWDDGNPTPTTTSYTYDQLGNLTYDQENGNTMAYEFFTDLPISIVNTLGTKEYRYNAGGVRTIKIIDGNKEFYLDGVVLADDQSVKSYQTATGYAIPTAAPAGVDFYYNVKDWLGTNREVVDENGDVTSARDHYAYGMLMPGRIFETDVEGKRYQFTGHEFDNEVNYGYHGARYYNRALGRYMSLDPLAAEYPSLSDYCYVAGNPIALIDPTGKSIENNNDWVKQADGTVYYDPAATSQASTKQGETYLSANKYDRVVLDAIGDHIMDSGKDGYENFINYIENPRLGEHYFLYAARKNYQTNATGIMGTLTNNFRSVEDGILISQMIHGWVEAAGWTAGRNALEHQIGMFVLADKYGNRVANLIGLGNEIRGLLVNDLQSGNVLNGLEGNPANNGGSTAFEWKDLHNNSLGLTKWMSYRGHWNADTNGDGHISIEENEKFNMKLGGLGE